MFRDGGALERVICSKGSNFFPLRFCPSFGFTETGLAELLPLKAYSFTLSFET